MTLSKKHLSGFFIDPVTRTVTEMKLEAKTLFNKVKELGGYDLGDIRRITDDVSLIVDDEGLLKPNAYWAFKGDPHPMAGKAFLIGMDREGEFCSMSPFIVASQISKMILWFENDADVEAAIASGLVDRPRSTMGSLGPDLQKVPGTETVLWEWHGKVEEKA